MAASPAAPGGALPPPLLLRKRPLELAVDAVRIALGGVVKEGLPAGSVC